MKQHVLVRFGKWQDIIEQDLPEDQVLCASTAMMRFVKSVAHSAMGDMAGAEREKAAFLETKAKVPGTLRVHNKLVVDILEIAWAMVDGELEYRRGNHQSAFDHLRRSIALDFSLALRNLGI